jgi:hypothetical protein
MKFWIAYKTSRSALIFNEEGPLISYVAKERIKGNLNVKIRVIEGNIIEETTVGNLFDSIEKSNELDHRINATLSDDAFFSDLEKFRSRYDRYTDGANTGFLTNLILNINDKKKVLNLIKRNKEYLLCEISDDVEWFECLIPLGIEEMVDGFYQKLNGWNTRVMVSKKRKENFLKAKKNLDLKSKE